MCLGRIKSFFRRPKAKVEAKQPEQPAKTTGEKAPSDSEKKAGQTS